jgi:L-threonylcarbamoyladenylate synthase
LLTLDCTDVGVTQCVQIIESGGVVAFPTDTVYGMGCNPYNDLAVRRVFEIKGREEKKPLPVLVLNIPSAEEMVELGSVGRTLAEKFWPGALTIVAPLKDAKVATGITAGRSSLAVRMPANRCVLRVLKICKHIVGTSANLSGKASPIDARSVMESLSGLDAILVDRNPIGGKESTIVDVTGTKPIIVRQGAIDAEAIMDVLKNERL